MQGLIQILTDQSSICEPDEHRKTEDVWVQYNSLLIWEAQTLPVCQIGQLSINIFFFLLPLHKESVKYSCVFSLDNQDSYSLNIKHSKESNKVCTK